MTNPSSDAAIRVLINGVAISDMQHAIQFADRGLHYGDGLFETMRLHRGTLQFFPDHMRRLMLGGERLQIEIPDSASLDSQLMTLIGTAESGIVKVIITRGASGRGYRPTPSGGSTCIAALYGSPPIGLLPNPISVRWCATRLSRNPLLAGIKHLNRLEQVIAQMEWRDEAVAEGLLLDYEDELICGIASNIFLVSGGSLCTPDLRYCGIRGVMRAQVFSAAHSLGLRVEECSLRAQDLIEASEIFVTNAIRGIRPVAALEERRWPIGPVTQRIAAQLQLW